MDKNSQRENLIDPIASVEEELTTIETFIQERIRLSLSPIKDEDTSLGKARRDELKKLAIVKLAEQKILARHRYNTSHRQFIGREKDIQEILSQLQYTRLLTLVGLPGVGKTELARQVGIEAKTRRYFAHVYFISLR